MSETCYFGSSSSHDFVYEDLGYGYGCAPIALQLVNFPLGNVDDVFSKALPDAW